MKLRSISLAIVSIAITVVYLVWNLAAFNSFNFSEMPLMFLVNILMYAMLILLIFSVKKDYKITKKKVAFVPLIIAGVFLLSVEGYMRLTAYNEYGDTHMTCVYLPNDSTSGLYTLLLKNDSTYRVQAINTDTREQTILSGKYTIDNQVVTITEGKAVELFKSNKFMIKKDEATNAFGGLVKVDRGSLYAIDSSGALSDKPVFTVVYNSK